MPALPSPLDIDTREPWPFYYNSASERAEAWLRSNLSVEQRNQLATYHAFVVTGNKRRLSGKRRRYVINYNHYGCSVVDERGVHYCIRSRPYPVGYYHLDTADVAVGLMLLLRTNERKFLRIAGWMTRTRYGVPSVLNAK